MKKIFSFKKIRPLLSKFFALGVGFFLIFFLSLGFYDLFKAIFHDISYFEGKQRLFLVIVFMSGFILQFISSVFNNSLSKDKNFKRAVMASLFVFSLGLILRGKTEVVYDFYFHALASIVIGGFTFCSIIKENLAPRINEKKLLIWSIFFFYTLYINNISNTWLLISIPFVLLSVLNIYTDWDKHKPIRVVLYISFLLMVVFVTIIYFRFSDLSFFFNNVSSNIRNLNVFITGILSAYIIPYFTHLLYLVPIRTKSETKFEFRKRLKDTVNNFSSYFDYSNNEPIKNTVFLIIIGLFLFFNILFNFMSHIYVLSVITILTFIIDFTVPKPNE